MKNKSTTPLADHPYHSKSDAELHYIIKDAGEASRLHDKMHKDTGKYNKYADQVNDAATILKHRKNTGVKEDAAGGSVGAGSIAVAPLCLGDMRKRGSLKQFLMGFYKNVKNKMQLKPITLAPIKEYYDLSDVVSRLKGVENSNVEQDNTVIYGVEDDNGNIMKITVKKDQAKDFEYRLSREMADAKENSLSGAMKVSLAELLYSLKDEFNIVDVEFPKIPKDVIYNANKATHGPDSSQLPEDDNVQDDTIDMNDQNTDMNPENAESLVSGDNVNPEEGGMEGGEDETGEQGEDNGEQVEDNGEEGIEPDDESVENFEEEPEPASPESLLQSVMDMLKKDAEARTAQANAAAEEARAKQAEYSYKASQATVAHEEEVARMEMEMDDQKKKEKEAKKLADIAKHRVTKAAMMRESLLQQVINEIEDFDTPQSLAKERSILLQKFRVMPTDSPDIANYKRGQLSNELKGLDVKLKSVRQRDLFNAMQKRKSKNAEDAARNQETRDVKQSSHM